MLLVAVPEAVIEGCSVIWFYASSFARPKGRCIIFWASQSQLGTVLGIKRMGYICDLPFCN